MVVAAKTKDDYSVVLRRMWEQKEKINEWREAKCETSEVYFLPRPVQNCVCSFHNRYANYPGVCNSACHKTAFMNRITMPMIEKFLTNEGKKLEDQSDDKLMPLLTVVKKGHLRTAPVDYDGYGSIVGAHFCDECRYVCLTLVCRINRQICVFLVQINSLKTIPNVHVIQISIFVVLFKFLLF